MEENIINKAKIKVNITKGDDMTKAIVVLDFGEFKIKGFRVQGNHSGNLWVNPPSILVGGKYRPVFYIENKKLWHDLQDMIIEKYNYEDIPVIKDK